MVRVETGGVTSSALVMGASDINKVMTIKIGINARMGFIVVENTAILIYFTIVEIILSDFLIFIGLISLVLSSFMLIPQYMVGLSIEPGLFEKTGIP